MPAFLFDPARVDRVLAVMPALRAQLQAPASEGLVAAVAGLRKTRREVYRLLANPHYRHLRETLRVIENTLAAGCDLGDLLSTSRHSQFSSRLSEAWAADHFLLKGFAVRTSPRTGNRGADLVVERKELSATIEVYSPRIWEALDDWMLELQDELKNLDEPFDFILDVNVQAPHGVDPWTVARALDLTAQDVIDAAVSDLVSALRAGEVGVARSYQHGNTGLETTVELREVHEDEGGKARALGVGRPSLSGYAPEGMFERLVHQNVLRRKAGKRQTQAATTRLRGMIVDLSRTQIAHDLRHDFYRTKAQAILEPVDVGAVGLDFIAFCGPNGLRRGLAADFVVYDEKALSEKETHEIFDVLAPIRPRNP